MADTTASSRMVRAAIGRESGATRRATAMSGSSERAHRLGTALEQRPPYRHVVEPGPVDQRLRGHLRAPAGKHGGEVGVARGELLPRRR